MAAAITGALPGDVVVYRPAIHEVAGIRVPEGVTVRGAPGAVLDGGGRAVLELTGGARLLGLTVTGVARPAT